MPLSVRRSLAGLIAAAVLMFPVAVTACGGTAPDANEPNDEPGAATTLVPGEQVDGSIGDDGDVDVFTCETPSAAGGEADAADEPGAAGEAEPRPFRVTVLTGAPDELDVEVGASIPGAPGGHLLAGLGRGAGGRTHHRGRRARCGHGRRRAHGGAGHGLHRRHRLGVSVARRGHAESRTHGRTYYPSASAAGRRGG